MGGRLHPVVGFIDAASVRVNLGTDLKNRPFKWEPGNDGKDFDAVPDSE